MTLMDKQQISDMIGVSDPYMWIDRVEQLSDEAIECRKPLPADLPVFSGHYHDFPLFPGALQCEAAFQASAVLIGKIVKTPSNRIPVIGRVRNVKFRRLVRPESELVIEVRIRERVGSAYYCKGTVRVDGKVTTELEFTATEADR